MSTTTLGVKLDEATRDRLNKLGERKPHLALWFIKEVIDRYLATEGRDEREKAKDRAR